MPTHHSSIHIPSVTSSTSIPNEVTSSPVTQPFTPDHITPTPDNITSTPNPISIEFVPPTPDNVISSTTTIPSTTDDADSYIEPAWCYEADTIQYTERYDSKDEAEEAVLNLIQLLLDDDITDTNVFYLRGRIVLYWGFEALPSNYRGSVAARY